MTNFEISFHISRYLDLSEGTLIQSRYFEISRTVQDILISFHFQISQKWRKISFGPDSQPGSGARAASRMLLLLLLPPAPDAAA